jgi:hypothetical protein
MTIRNAFNSGLMASAMTLLLAGCSAFQKENRVIIPAAPPLPADALERIAGSCRKDIDRVNGRLPYVPEERRKEFKTMMDLAEDTCDSMVETLERLKAAARQEQTLKQSLQHAESTIAQDARDTGTMDPGANNPVSSEPIDTNASSTTDYDINSQTIPQDTLGSGPLR